MKFRARNSEGGEDPNKGAGEKDFKTLYENTVKSRDEERTARQTLATQVEELSKKLGEYDKEKENASKSEEEKKLKDKQKFDELEAKWKDEKKALEDRIAEQEPVIKSYRDTQTKQLEELSKQVPEAKKALVDGLLNGKSIEEKLTLLPTIVTEFKGSGFGGAPNGDGGAQGDKDVDTKVKNAGSFSEGLKAVFETASKK